MPPPTEPAFGGAIVSTAVVRLGTALGDIDIELYLLHAPRSAGQFLEIATSGLLVGGRFWRSVRSDNDRGTPPIEVLQAMAPEAATVSLPPIPHESTSQTGLIHEDGTVSLARGEPGSASAAAFFICIGAQPALDAGSTRNADGLGFAAFGRVVRGMETVRAIHGDATADEAPVDYIRGQILVKPVEIVSSQVLLDQCDVV